MDLNMVLSYNWMPPSVAGHFNGHGEALKRYMRHHTMQHVQGYTGSHWMPPSGDYSLCIAPWPPGRQSTQWLWNMYPLCWPFRWPSQCSGTISRALPDGGGLWLSLKQLNATIGRALTPIASNRTRQLRLFRTFHREKELQLTCWPLITIGVWHIKLTRST